METLYILLYIYIYYIHYTTYITSYIQYIYIYIYFFELVLEGKIHRIFLTLERDLFVFSFIYLLVGWFSQPLSM